MKTSKEVKAIIVHIAIHLSLSQLKRKDNLFVCTHLSGTADHYTSCYGCPVTFRFIYFQRGPPHSDLRYKKYSYT